MVGVCDPVPVLVPDLLAVRVAVGVWVPVWDGVPVLVPDLLGVRVFVGD